jgi:type IV pilus assembly protein PilC
MSFMRQWLYTWNRPEPLRQATLLLMLSGAAGRGEDVVCVLRAHQRATRGEWSALVAQLATLVESGHSLGTALMLVEGLLPRTVIAAIVGAEASGAAAVVMRDEADRLIRQMTDHSPGRGMLPVILAATGGVLVGMLAFLSIHMAPKLMQVFVDFGAELPAVTTFLLDFGQWLSKSWNYLVLPGFCFAGWGSWYSWRNAQHQLIHGGPLFAGSSPRYWVPNLLRIFSNSVACGAPLMAGVNALIQQMPAGSAAKSMFELRGFLENGDSIPDALARSRLLRRRDSAVLQASAASGHLDWGLRQLADHLEHRRTQRALRLRTVVLYGLYGVISLIVFWFVVAFLLPLIMLTVTLSQEEIA